MSKKRQPEKCQRTKRGAQKCQQKYQQTHRQPPTQRPKRQHRPIPNPRKSAANTRHPLPIKCVRPHRGASLNSSGVGQTKIRLGTTTTPNNAAENGGGGCHWYEVPRVAQHTPQQKLSIFACRQISKKVLPHTIVAPVSSLLKTSAFTRKVK